MNLKDNPRVLGIIAEYNPMHYGHIYHLRQAKKISRADFVVAVISGSFSQRGEPCILDKWTRSRIALNQGVDLVLEIPCFYACNSAAYFAKGALAVLRGLGIVSHLSFGVEKGNLKEMEELATLLREEPEPYGRRLKEHLKGGMSFPKARAAAVADLWGEEKARLLSSPNNILAISYLSDNPPFKAVPVIRRGDYHDLSLSVEYPGATAIRRACYQGRWKEIEEKVPRETFDALRSQENHFPDQRVELDLLKGVLSKKSPRELATFFSVGEGMEHKIKGTFRHASGLDEWVHLLKSRRYTYNTIRRMLAHILLDMKTDRESESVSYARILGANEQGKILLRKIKKEKRACVPLITKVDAQTTDALLCQDVRSTDIYNIITRRDLYKNCDFVRKPVM